LLDEGDRVALRVCHPREQHLVRGRVVHHAGIELSFAQAAELFLEIVHAQSQQGSPGAVGVLDHLDHAGLGEVPLG
jgi:hypothetical protein